MRRVVHQSNCNPPGSTVYRLRSTCPSPPSTVYRLPSTRLRRSGFTLVELLLVIVIIGMLVALVSVAAVRALGIARNAQITTEIGLLDSAMQTYKNDTGGAYPPDFTLLTTPANNASGPTTTGSPNDVQNRQNRILAHFRKAFPRLIIPGGYGTMPSPSAGTLQYMSQSAFKNSTAYGTTFTSGIAPNGVSTYGDFDNLDPAEAMVFWLGGFAVPVPDPSGKVLYKMIGFSANKVGNASSSGPNASGPNAGFGPFNLDVTSRDMGPFEFNQGRLGDADGDGWPEYYPPNAVVPQPPGTSAVVANPTPPYVYFDAISYGYYNTPNSDIGAATWTSAPVYPLSAVYPSPLSPITPQAAVTPGLPGAQPIMYAATWGTAIPYCQTVSNSGSASITWANPNKFQIVSAGLDLMYWFDPRSQLVKNILRGYPSGVNYSQGDLDNLTNFSTGTLQQAQP